MTFYYRRNCEHKTTDRTKEGRMTAMFCEGHSRGPWGGTRKGETSLFSHVLVILP
jgi:hypothetical protein